MTINANLPASSGTVASPPPEAGASGYTLTLGIQMGPVLLANWQNQIHGRGQAQWEKVLLYKDILSSTA